MSRRRRACPAVIAALIVTVAWLGGSASARAANRRRSAALRAVSCSGQSATCTAVGSPGESFTFATSGSGTFSAPSCTIAASTSSCSVTYTPADHRRRDTISYGAERVLERSVDHRDGNRAPQDIFACTQQHDRVRSARIAARRPRRHAAGHHRFRHADRNNRGHSPRRAASRPSGCPTSYQPASSHGPQVAHCRCSWSERDHADHAHRRPPGHDERQLRAGHGAHPRVDDVHRDGDRHVDRRRAAHRHVQLHELRPGSFSSSRCNLTGTGTTASCSVSYTPSVVGSGAHTITAAYNGDSGHAIDTASASLAVAARRHRPRRRHRHRHRPSCAGPARSSAARLRP